MDTKYCPQCKKDVDTSQFTIRTRGGLGGWCRKCVQRKNTESRRKRKRLLVEYKGGRCELCGYDKFYGALDFHHKDPLEKKIRIAQMSLISFERLKPEIDKCMLLCADCHREIEYQSY
jgi:hypothetical protein